MNPIRVWATLVGAILLTVAIGLVVGEPLSTLSSKALQIVINMRLLRITVAILVGLALGASGATLQGALANPLADPYVLGISSGAGLGAAVAVAFFSSASLGIALPVISIILATSTMVLVTGGVSLIGRHSPANFILVGIAVNACFSALTLLAMVLAGPRMNWVLLWLMGDFSQTGMIQLGLSGAVILIGIGILLNQAQALDAMTLGDDTATGFGFNVKRTRMTSILIASILTAVAVCMGGIIGFIALVVPHIIRRFGIVTHYPLIVSSSLLAALLLTVCEVLIRVIPTPTQLPIGVVTALIGAPMFFILLWKQRNAL